MSLALSPEVMAGQALLLHKRAELAFNHPVMINYQPERFNVEPAELQRFERVEVQKPAAPERVKIYPSLGLSSLRAHQGGAWRAWTFARWIDQAGSGKVEKRELAHTLRELGADERRARRWITSAVKIGLFCPVGRVYKLAGLSKAAELLKVDYIGRAVSINRQGLLSRGWCSMLWAAYLTTLHERPVSQKTKSKLTGISPRLQRYYQAGVGAKRGNYAQTNLRPDQVTGMEAVEGGHYFLTKRGHVLRRLPDIRLIPFTVAELAPRGRSKKAQKALNSCSYVEREIYRPLRQFCENPKQLKATERQLAKSDLLPWDLPQELYQLAHVGRANNLWDAVQIGAPVL